MWYLFAKLFGLRGEVVIASVEKISLKPGDKLVVTIDRHLSVDQYEIIKKNFEKNFAGSQIIILDGGLKLSVIHREGVQSNERDTKDLPPEGTTPDET